jgi:hypothetical protein
MSYRNPQQNVDTQSAQGIANLQRTVAGAFGGIVQQEIAEQKELAKKQAKLAEKREKELKEYNIQEANVAMGIKKVEIDNPALNIGESFGPLVDGYSDIMTKINSGSITDPKEIAALRSQAADILTLPKRLGNMLEGLSIVDQNIEATQDRMGKMGGLDPSTPGGMYENMQVLMNKKPGKRETNIDYKNGKYVTTITITPEGGEPTTYTENQIRKYASGESEGVRIIPDETKDMENLKDTHIYKKVNGKTIIKEEAFGELTTREVKNSKGEVSTQTYRPLKRGFLLGRAQPVIDANVKAMSINEQVAFMNNIVSPGNKAYSTENIGTEENQKALRDGYGNYWLDNFATDDVVSTTSFKADDSSKGVTGDLKREIEATGESITTEPMNVFKGTKVNGLRVEDVEIDGSNVKIILDNGVITEGNEKKMKIKEVDYDLSNAEDVRNIASKVYRKNTKEYKVLVDYLYRNAKSKTDIKKEDIGQPIRTWSPN